LEQVGHTVAVVRDFVQRSADPAWKWLQHQIRDHKVTSLSLTTVLLSEFIATPNPTRHDPD